jgi:hypothetical protein
MRNKHITCVVTCVGKLRKETEGKNGFYMFTVWDNETKSLRQIEAMSQEVSWSGDNIEDTLDMLVFSEFEWIDVKIKFGTHILTVTGNSLFTPYDIANGRD